MPNKIYVAGRNQTKTVTPSNVQQIVSPDTGYNALDSVVVNPIKAAMPQTIEQFVMRDDNMEPFSLNLDGAVPENACYQQSKLVAVYGTPTSIGGNAFSGCINLQEIKTRDVTRIGIYAFRGCNSLRACDFRNVTQASTYAFQENAGIQAIDFRNIVSLGGQMFYQSGGLKLLDITNTHNATLAGGLGTVSPNLVILVADDTDKAHYQSATNWSAYASQIKTVAEYEQQIGMSYDVYYEQIFGHPRFDTEEAQT